MKINGGGLDILVTKMVLDVRYGVAAVKHINSARMSEAMNGVDILETFGRKGLFEILSADTVNAMTGQSLSSLIDKKTVFIKGL